MDWRGLTVLNLVRAVYLCRRVGHARVLKADHPLSNLGLVWISAVLDR